MTCTGEDCWPVVIVGVIGDCWLPKEDGLIVPSWNGGGICPGVAVPWAWGYIANAADDGCRLDGKNPECCPAPGAVSEAEVDREPLRTVLMLFKFPATPGIRASFGASWRYFAFFRTPSWQAS